jgi:fructose-bisphosphate aldolase class I
MRAAPFVPGAESIQRDMRVHAACDDGAYLSAERKVELKKVADYIATPGKGITACDEGPGTIGMRLEAVGMVNTEENRRKYRQMLFEAPGAPESLSAAILDPETLHQKSDTSGKLFPEALKDMGVMPGVKPHLKVYTLPGTGGETVMQGLDSLNVRLKEYKAAGAVFAKWRSPLIIGKDQPSDLAIQANMNDLARYALICQDEGLVPIVEPDVSLKGDHDLEAAMVANVRIQSFLYKAMLDHGVYMEGTILKVNMVNPGLSCPIQYTAEQIAEANVRVLQQCMPVAIPGVNYLSGGQNLEDASARLTKINEYASGTNGKCPWNLSFSWSAALQMPLFELCRGKEDLPLAEMSELYASELKIAAAAAKGVHTPAGTDGYHVPKVKAAPAPAAEPVATPR